MSYGLEIYNQSNYLQLSQNYSGYRVIQEGLVNINNSYYGTSKISSVIYFPAQATPPLILVSAPPVGDFIGADVFSNGFQIFCTTRALTLNYKVIGLTKNQPASSETYGLRVYGSDGSLSFDSGHSMFAVQGILTMNATRSYANYATMPINRSGAFVSVNNLQIFASFDLMDDESELVAAVVGFDSDNIVHLGTDFLYPGPPMGDTESNYTATCLVGRFNL